MSDEVVTDPATRIDRLLSAAEPRIARVFREAIKSLRDRIDLNRLADQLQSGNLEAALDDLQEAAERLGQASNAVFINAGQSTSEFLAGADVARVVFDVTNQGAVNALRINTLRLIRDFREDQRGAVRAALNDSLQRGVNPRDAARAFRSVVGLTERQSQAVNNYRRLLGQQQDGAIDVPSREALQRALRDGRHDRTVDAAIRRGAPLSQEQLDQMVERYADRYVKYRAEVIGRTEALRSVNQGTEEAYRQALASGRITHDRITRKWVSAHDDRVRESHRHLDGMERPYGATFPGLYGELRYPGDPSAPAAETVQCRCILTTRLKPSKG